MSNAKLLQFVNCRILRDHVLQDEDLWIRNGKIVNPESVFYEEKIRSDIKVDCKGAIIAPGFIDLQINGGFGYDFSFNKEDVEAAVSLVAKRILTYGVTAFCPTIVTSPKETYRTVLNKIHRKAGDRSGATVLGVHLEGPFIAPGKKGAHPPEHIKPLDLGMFTVEEMYGNLKNVAIVTIAPELDGAMPVILELSKRDITVSVGHSMADLKCGEEAVNNGASFITHLFNAMLPFHHRDPGLVGLLTSNKIPGIKTVYFGIISDGVHTHPAALRIAHRAHPSGLCLVTDAISAMGLEAGTHNIGQFKIDIRNGKAYVAGTNTLCGSIANMNECVKIFRKATGCSLEYALEVASLHPAKALHIESTKGTLNYDSDADFILLNDNLDVISTWIAGECVYMKG